MFAVRRGLQTRQPKACTHLVAGYQKRCVKIDLKITSPRCAFPWFWLAIGNVACDDWFGLIVAFVALQTDQVFAIKLIQEPPQYEHAIAIIRFSAGA